MATTLSHSSESPPDARVEDYLEDKLQSAADLDTLDELLATVDLQRTQLQSQLDRAVQQLDVARRTTQDRHALLQEHIADFFALQESIDGRLQETAASDAPSVAIARLQRPVHRLRTVELARRYLLLLQDVEALRREATACLPADPTAALRPYARLKELSLALGAAPGSEALHLVAHVEAVTERVWAEMKDIMSAELETVLRQRGWPRVDPQSQMDDDWVACFEKLLDLQMPEILHGSQAAAVGAVVPLLPVHVMAQIFVAEFRFHFLGDKMTSRASSMGSHCFPWLLALLDKWHDFFRDNMAPVLAVKFYGTPAADRSVYADPVCALITSMLTVMREKVEAVAQEAVGHPAFLSAFIAQLIQFDDAIRSRFGYDGGDAENGWPGLTTQVLDRHFEVWFGAERALALERFEAIMEAPDARKIDYDYHAGSAAGSMTAAEGGRMKPTFAAVRTTDLLRGVTAKYERLRSLRHKVRFLTRIQLDIMDAYHDRLRGSLEAYASMTSALGRTLHGATREQLAALEGLGALETLCKIIGSADHVVVTLREWSDEEVFVALWDELQSVGGTLDGGAGTSTLGGGDADEETRLAVENGRNGGGMFDETVAAFESRRGAAEEILTSTLADAHYKVFRAYMQRPQWTTIGDDDDAADLSITAELDLPLETLRRQLDFLNRTLSRASCRRVWRGALAQLQDLLWNGVLMRHRFTALGGAQLGYDVRTMAALAERFLGPGVLTELREATELLRLPTTGDGGATTLGEARARAYRDNDGARGLVEGFGLGGLLAPAEVRRVLERRVEGEEDGW